MPRQQYQQPLSDVRTRASGWLTEFCITSHVFRGGACHFAQPRFRSLLPLFINSEKTNSLISTEMYSFHAAASAAGDDSLMLFR